MNDYKAQALILDFIILIGGMFIGQGLSLLMNIPSGYQFDTATQSIVVVSFAQLIIGVAYAIMLENKCYKMLGGN